VVFSLYTYQVYKDSRGFKVAAFQLWGRCLNTTHACMRFLKNLVICSHQHEVAWSSEQRNGFLTWMQDIFCMRLHMGLRFTVQFKGLLGKWSQYWCYLQGRTHPPKTGGLLWLNPRLSNQQSKQCFNYWAIPGLFTPPPFPLSKEDSKWWCLTLSVVVHNQLVPLVHHLLHFL